MSTEKAFPGKPDKKKMQVTQQIFHTLGEIVELYPQYSIPQHLSAILRRKDTKDKEFFFWNDEELLKKIQAHKEELEGEDLMTSTEDDLILD